MFTELFSTLKNLKTIFTDGLGYYMGFNLWFCFLEFDYTQYIVCKYWIFVAEDNLIDVLVICLYYPCCQRICQFGIEVLTEAC